MNPNPTLNTFLEIDDFLFRIGAIPVMQDGEVWFRPEVATVRGPDSIYYEMTGQEKYTHIEAWDRAKRYARLRIALRKVGQQLAAA